MKKIPRSEGVAQDLASHLAALDAETLRRDEIEREHARQEESRAKEDLAKALQARKFGDTVGVIGLGFAVLVTVLPPNDGKATLYLLAATTVLVGVFVRDRAHKKVGRLLPLLSASDLGARARGSRRELGS